MEIDKAWKSQLKDNILTLNSWDIFIQFINEHEKLISTCLYRGQRNQDWSLKPSLFRLIPDDLFKSKFPILYSEQLEQFKLHTRGRHNIPYDSPFDDDLKWWSLGQHYGLATPLLDWVHSPYVATFFSFIEEKNDQSNNRAIYILDFQLTRKVRTDNIAIQNRRLEKVEILTHDNTRLVSQQGELIYISPINQTNHISIENYIEQLGYSGDEILLLKIVLPNSERPSILCRLNQMNINSSTLFPDLTGASEYCNYLISSHQ